MMFPQISCLNPARLAVVAFFVLCSSAAASALPPNPTLDAQIESSLAHAATQLTATVAYLEDLSAAESNPARRPHFPQFTANTFTTPNSPRPHGHWHTSHATSSFWAKGSFAALLWMMADLAEDPAEQGEWRGWARKWSEPLRNYTGNDLTVNNYAVFRRWMEQAESGAEREAQRQTILEATRLLVVPYDRTSNTGRFLEEAGIYGYRRRAATGVFWFHAFIDHTPNVEQLLAASWLTDDPGEALGFREKAVSHILNLHRTMGPLRSPGEAGS
ncbi:MAG: hypothetical protein JJT96_14095 [Opitutales bacterium]|nr:hypothetical protein [Opitutales bacterium]